MNIARHILLVAEFSEASDEAVTMAGELARRLDAKLTLLNMHGRPPEPPEAYVPREQLYLKEDMDADAMEGLQKLRSSKFADIEGIILAVAMDGNPSHAIYDYAARHDVDLIVMGNHGRTGLAHFFLGSVAEKVVHHAPCPVLIVPHNEACPSMEVMPESWVIHQAC